MTETARTAPWWVKAIVLWHVFCITVWSCPSPSEAQLNGKSHPARFAIADHVRLFDSRYLKQLKLVKAYLFGTGTWQYWDMFAPNPADTDWYCDAVIHYKDGTSKVAGYPRMYTLSIPQKYLQERFRKFFERSHDEIQKAFFFEPFIYREALENYKDRKNPPVKVELRRHWKRNMLPGEPEAKVYSQYAYFVGEIDPVQLNRLVREQR